jgi:hypothetical protein
MNVALHYPCRHVPSEKQLVLDVDGFVFISKRLIVGPIRGVDPIHLLGGRGLLCGNRRTGTIRPRTSPRAGMLVPV